FGLGRTASLLGLIHRRLCIPLGALAALDRAPCRRKLGPQASRLCLCALLRRFSSLGLIGCCRDVFLLALLTPHRLRPRLGFLSFGAPLLCRHLGCFGDSLLIRYLRKRRLRLGRTLLREPTRLGRVPRRHLFALPCIACRDRPRLFALARIFGCFL